MIYTLFLWREYLRLLAREEELWSFFPPPNPTVSTRKTTLPRRISCSPKLRRSHTQAANLRMKLTPSSCTTSRMSNTLVSCPLVTPITLSKLSTILVLPTFGSTPSTVTIPVALVASNTISDNPLTIRPSAFPSMSNSVLVNSWVN